MNIDSRSIISVTDANQNFSRVVKMVEENGKAILFKRNKPKYIVLDINDQESIIKALEELKGQDDNA